MSRSLRDHRLVPYALLALSVTLAGWLVPASASATRHFLHPSGRPAGILVGSGGALQIHALAGAGEATNFLAWKTLSGDWTNVPNPTTPTTVTSFFLSTGVAGVNATGFGGPRVYVVSENDGSGSQLWEYRYTASGGVWRPLGKPSGASFDNSPAIAAALDGVDASVWVGIRTSNDGHVWSCHVSSDTAGCIWEDESCRPSSNCAIDNHPAALSSAIAVDTSGAEREFYTVDPAGHIQRYRWQADSWTSLPLAGGLATDTTTLQAWNNGTDFFVAGMVIDPALDADALVVGHAVGSGSWTMSPLMVPIGSFGFTPSQNDLAVGQTGSTTTLFASDGPTLWACAWSGTACTWTSLGAPPDQVDPQSLGGGIWAASATSVFVTGQLSAAEYLFQSAPPSVQAAPQWSNHLAPHTAGSGMSLPPLMNLGEYDGDERGGTVVFTATAIESPDLTFSCEVIVARSIDDFQNADVYKPFGGVNLQPDDSTRCGDQTVSFDGVGHEFVASIHPGSRPFYVEVVRWDPTIVNWSTPYAIPVTTSNNTDRPVMLADRLRSNFLYLTWSADSTNAGGQMTYCYGGAGGCTADPTGWCTTTRTLPSSTGCSADTMLSSPGCWIDQAGDGTVWVMIQDDSGCSPRTGFRAVGVRDVTNRAALDASCTPPELRQSPYCLYYVAEPPLAGNQLHGGDDSPGAYRRWGARLIASRDSGRVAVAVQSYQDLAGGACTTGGTHLCRSDQYFAYLDPVNGWCGASCALVPDPSTMRAINQDQVGSPLPWVDHFLGGVVALDYGQWGATWLDFRGDVTNDVAFRDGVAGLTIDGTTHTVVATDGIGGPTGKFALFTTDTARNQAWYGDVNRHANGRGHAHFSTAFAAPSTQQYVIPGGFAWSPAAPTTSE